MFENDGVLGRRRSRRHAPGRTDQQQLYGEVMGETAELVIVARPGRLVLRATPDALG